MAANLQFQTNLDKKCRRLLELKDELEADRFDLFTTGFKSVDTTEAICSMLDSLFSDVESFWTLFLDIPAADWNVEVYHGMRREVLMLTLRAAELQREIFRVTVI